MQIVLLEDDNDAREAMAALLGMDGHSVVQAHDPDSFGRATSDLGCLAVIFDLQLADAVVGLTLAMDYQTRRRAAGLAPATLIALSGSANPDEVIAAAGAPFPVDHRFRKPANYAELLCALTR